MKLLYITNGITGAGGLERVLAVKASLLAEKFGYEVHILTLNESPEAKPFFEFSDKIKRHSIAVHGNPLKYWKLYRIRIRQKVAEINPDVISVCDDGLKGFYIPRILKIKIPIIYERHASLQISAKSSKIEFKHKMVNFLMQKNAQSFDKFVLLTEGNLKEWPAGNLAVIPNPLPFTVEKNADLSVKTVISVGSLSYNKGTDLLLEIWEKVSKNFPDWKLEIYGKSADSNYEELNQKKNLRNVFFNPPVSDIQQKYVEASVFVLPSRSEGFGMVIIEAMACGLPVVSFDCPHGPGDIVTDGKDGFLIENGNTDQFAEKLALLMKDIELRKKFGTEAKITAQNYRPETIVAVWDQLFKTLTSRSNF